MRLGNIERVNRNESISELKKKEEVGKKDLVNSQQNKSFDLAVDSLNSYEKLESQSETQTPTYNLEILEELKERAENLYEKVVVVVEETIGEQILLEDKIKKEEILDLLKEGFLDKNEDRISREENIEKLSEKISQLVKEASKGEEGKINILRLAVEEGFNRLEEDFGELPEISKETWKRIEEKLDAFILAESLKNDEDRLENLGRYKKIMEKVKLGLRDYRYLWPFLYGGDETYFYRGGKVSRLRKRFYLLFILIALFLYYAIKLIRK